MRIWPELKKSSIIALDLNKLQDLKQYKNLAKIKEVIRKEYDTEHLHPISDIVWDFANEIKVGDIILLKAGERTLLGYGEVINTYQYNQSFRNYPHIIRMKWLNLDKHDIIDPLPQQILFKLTKLKNWQERFENYFTK